MFEKYHEKFRLTNHEDIGLLIENELKHFKPILIFKFPNKMFSGVISLSYLNFNRILSNTIVLQIKKSSARLLQVNFRIYFGI